MLFLSGIQVLRTSRLEWEWHYHSSTKKIWKNHLLCMFASCVCTANTHLVVFPPLTKHDFDISGFPNKQLFFQVKQVRIISVIYFESYKAENVACETPRPHNLFVLSFHMHMSYVLTIPDPSSSMWRVWLRHTTWRQY